MYQKFETLISERGVTPYRISQDTKIPQTTFSDWKSGRSKPKADKLLVLAKYFDVPIEYFLEGDTP
ncbi:helix-turn-helix transcriptional regulator [Aminipila butyrica]|uniref:Helix-turn-helix transcriptional regulator n=1 Tax=Aminipila butyrica TaxID=433296 RepID=A0A858BVX5_9FIRM|nr:helix-turn-helix transcriptional regulator [Aminipila butyrica]QIB68226.1 helix-turn-helix transcriptional regulator [Aminipila butyrica]